MALAAERLPRVLTAGAAAELVFDLYDDGAPALDLAGATATATLRRSGTPRDAAELVAHAVELDAACGRATLALGAADTLALAPLAGASAGRFVGTVRVVVSASVVHVFGPFEREIWAAGTT